MGNNCNSQIKENIDVQTFYERIWLQAEHTDIETTTKSITNRLIKLPRWCNLISVLIQSHIQSNHSWRKMAIDEDEAEIKITGEDRIAKEMSM